MNECTCVRICTCKRGTISVGTVYDYFGQTWHVIRGVKRDHRVWLTLARYTSDPFGKRVEVDRKEIMERRVQEPGSGYKLITEVAL